MYPILVLLALLGHAFLWIGLVNRLHSVGARRWIIKSISYSCFSCAGLIPIGIGLWYANHPEHLATAPWEQGAPESGFGSIVALYVAFCWMIAAVTLVRLVYLRCVGWPTSIVHSYQRRRAEIDPSSVAATAEETAHHPLCRLPLNEILQLDVVRCTLDVPRLTPELNGLSIVHFSDLHLTGRVGKAYFREVVRLSNEMSPDLVCITGDLVDRTKCFDWIPDTLGRLTARYGVYFILGNHDRRVDFGRLRRLLEQNGLIDLGAGWRTITIGGASLRMGGSERPWFGERSGQSGPDRSEPQCSADEGATPALRIALAHTPDQLAWARKNNVDLLLVGHTHGGQIRIPPLGAIFSPTAKGVRYVSGMFYASPTILHVSRGVSGDIPLRWNCRPEITRLELHAGRR